MEKLCGETGTLHPYAKFNQNRLIGLVSSDAHPSTHLVLDTGHNCHSPPTPTSSNGSDSAVCIAEHWHKIELTPLIHTKGTTRTKIPSNGVKGDT